MNSESGETEIAGQEDEQGVERNETLQRENQELREMLKIRDARDEMTGALKNAGARSPGLLFAYAVDDLQFDAEGRVVNSAALVEKMRRSFPEQFGREAAPQIDAGAGGAGKTNYLTKEALAKMQPAEIAKLDWAEVRQVLAGN